MLQTTAGIHLIFLVFALNDLAGDLRLSSNVSKLWLRHLGILDPNEFLIVV